MNEPDRRIRRIAIVGGGGAAWMAAATLARKLGGSCSIHVVDSGETLTAGLAEATRPTVLELLRFLGIDQNDFIDKTQSTYSLGRRLVDWAAPGESFWHPFGAFGALIERRPFYHFWHKARALGLKPRLEHFSLEASMAAGNRFIFPTNTLGIAQHMHYALHADAALATRYLRSIAERAGVIRLERKLVHASRREDGCVEELKFEDGGNLRADLFVDCSGTRAQLVGEILGVTYEDWRRWLPCDRQMFASTPIGESRPPYVRISARASGWQWRTPLQVNASVGHVYASGFIDDEAARLDLVSAAGSTLVEPRVVSFVNGRRQRFWEKNVVALGAAAGFLEPLAGTDSYLLGSQLFNLLDHFPDRAFDPALIASYNAAVGDEFERARDFLLLHYVCSRRADSPFWQQCRAVELPATLAQRLEIYRATGRIMQRAPEAFTDLDWFWILEGSGVVPRDYDPLVDTVDFEQVKRLMLALSQKISADTAAAPSHDSFFAAVNLRLAGARKAAVAVPAG
ncbi:MAG TPA: tryptophan halogenase family protein [Steroidobacteraceae bacterium]|nr:tryptophan halogenase family protein [Steroidobacteraceae bacterium]